MVWDWPWTGYRILFFLIGLIKLSLSMDLYIPGSRQLDSLERKGSLVMGDLQKAEVVKCCLRVHLLLIHYLLY
jgi:hypothetical protein